MDFLLSRATHVDEYTTRKNDRSPNRHSKRRQATSASYTVAVYTFVFLQLWRLLWLALALSSLL
jgi:hypothetical protein